MIKKSEFPFKKAPRVTLCWIPFRMHLGRVLLAASQRGIVRIVINPKKADRVKSGAILSACKRHLERCKLFLRRWESGTEERIKKNVPVDFSGLTPFQKKILMCLRDTRRGETLTYGQLARRSGFPHSARAVGNALNRNPVPILIPCHRVVKQNGSLGGFALGINWKRRLLQTERVFDIKP